MLDFQKIQHSGIRLGVNDYKKLVAEIFDGKRKVNNSTDQMPKVSVKLNERQGMIK